jgi:antitoxin HigA-1
MFTNKRYTAYNIKGETVWSRVPVHPGEILKEEIEARGVKKNFVARKMGITPGNLSDLLAGRRNVTAEMALKIEGATGINAEFWLRAQNRHDLTVVRNRHEDENTSA